MLEAQMREVSVPPHDGAYRLEAARLPDDPAIPMVAPRVSKRKGRGRHKRRWCGA